ncbi:ERF superfamily protein (plasmid) [Borrelia crocidurae DOU]|uniref:ERF superfamily protein n=1 Tax=Borrelia crocidurae DOU TaxID=1293575 RepID=W5SL10_9SPIR|nr:recombinase RecT [Borrelia crocidurae]AHH07570.1 ERF superfamily protein [Borrelia crocidurae DOU]
MNKNNNMLKNQSTNTVDVIIDKMNSSNIAEVWETYKIMHNLKKIDAYSEREILTLLQVNKLNPFKKEAYIIPFNGRYTVVVAYQTLLIRAYEAGYNKYDLDFEEKLVKSLKIDSKGNKKYYCYQNLLIASRNMYNFLSDKPFGSLSEINDYLESVKSGDDSKLLEYFNKNKMLKSIEYWCNLIKEYFTKSSRDLSKLEKFNIFMSFDLDKVGNSPLKLFSQLSITKEFQCLFSLT